MSIRRREFLKDVAATAGLAFVRCGLGGGAAAQPARAAGVRRQVTVKGRRIRTVDVHAHCAVPAASALLRRPAATAGGDGPLVLDGQTLADRIAVMDAQGIDVAVLSINPNWYDADRDLATQVVSVQNEGLAQFCASHADRFAAFASVALQFPDLAAARLERAMKTMGFRGSRSDHGCVTFPAQCKPGMPKLHPTEYVKRMYYDSLVFTSEGLRHLAAEVGAGHIMMGTDYPFPWVDAPMD